MSDVSVGLNRVFIVNKINYFIAKESTLNTTCKIMIVFFSMLITACAANRGGVKADNDYVEVTNPFATSSPNAPSTIWVPRSDAESGVPRATDLIKKGFSKMTAASDVSQPAANVPASATTVLPSVQTVQPVASVQPLPVSIPLKNLIAVLDVKESGLLLPLSNKLETLGGGILLDHHDPSFMAKHSTFSNMTDRGDVSQRMQQEFGAIVSVFVSGPDRIAPGKIILGSVYDGLSGKIVRTVEAQIPDYSLNDPAAQNAALAVALDGLAGRLKSVIAFLPWRGKIVTIEKDHIFINAGSEAGVRLGQLLKVYRDGKVIPGVGFVLGDQVATVEIRGLVGANSAYGVVTDGKVPHVNDIVTN